MMKTALEPEKIVEKSLEQGFSNIDLLLTPLPHILNSLKQRYASITESTLQIKDRCSSRAKTLSALHGTGAFPHHTDFAFCSLPPPLILLANNTANWFSRQTTITRLHTIDNEAQAMLARSRWRLKTSQGNFVVAGKIPSSLSDIFRWDTNSLQPENSYATDCLHYIPDALTSCETYHEWRPYCGLLINNWLCTHAREHKKSNEENQNRLLKRYEVWQYASLV